MREQLIIFLQPQDLEHPKWGIPQKGLSFKGDTERLKAFAKECEVIVYVPTSDVLLTEVALPKLSRHRLLQALPFALEENLIDDVGELHFAIGPISPDQTYPVAVVSRQKMTRWLHVLAAWHVNPAVLMPDVFALPVEAGICHIACTKEGALLRVSETQGFFCETENLPLLLPPEVKTICLHHDDSIPLPTFPEEITIIEKKEATIARSPKGVDATQVPINLLQGLFAPKKSKFAHAGKLQHLLTATVVILLALLICYPTVSFFILRNRLNDIEKDMVAIYKQHFPKATSLVDPKRRMAEALKKQTEGNQENRLLVLLGILSRAMQAEEIELKRFDFQRNQLTLTLNAENSEIFTALVDFLKNQGLSVKQQDASLSGEKVSALIVIE